MATKAWEVGDSFWARVEPLILKAQREKGKEYQPRKRRWAQTDGVSEDF